MASSKILTLITGANQGVGFETAKNLLTTSSAYHILLGSRDPVKGEKAVETLKSLPIQGTVEVVQIDVLDDNSVDAAAKYVSENHGRLDVLVNNAGIFSKNPSPRQACREIFAVNVVGVISVTEAFLPLLRKSAAPRLIFVGSSVGSLTHASNPESKYYLASANEYRASKSALNMVMNQYWVKTKQDGFKVHGADPGLIATNLVDIESVRKRGALEGDVGGQRIATVVKGERDEDVGKLCGEYGVSPW